MLDSSSQAKNGEHKKNVLSERGEMPKSHTENLEEFHSVCHHKETTTEVYYLEEFLEVDTGCK